MIVAPAGGQLLVITQNDHAHFAGQVLALWRSDGLPDHPRRRQLLFAAREHDNGWAEIDSAPMCDAATGRPLDFMTVSDDTRREIWRRGTRRHLGGDPYAALLIVRHAIRLHRSRLGDPAWADLVAEWRELEAQLMAAADTTAAAVAGDDRWLELTDLWSLAVCNRWQRQVESHGRTASVSAAAGGEILAGNLLLVDPFPLAGATTFRIACRLIPERRYSGDADLGAELAIARWRDYSVQIAPGV